MWIQGLSDNCDEKFTNQTQGSTTTLIQERGIAMTLERNEGQLLIITTRSIDKLLLALDRVAASWTHSVDDFSGVSVSVESHQYQQCLLSNLPRVYKMQKPW